MVPESEPIAYLDEVFPGIQGEGPYVGVRQVFVRFSGCPLDCAYCDSQRARRRSERCTIADSDAAGATSTVSNPIDLPLLQHLIAAAAGGAPIHSIAVTGGEPLVQVDFLAAWLARLANDQKVYFEASGIMPERMALIAPYVSICAMDMKLRSTAGGMPRWTEHEEFLRVCSKAGMDVYVKAVVGMDTSVDEVQTCARLIERIRPETVLILQPVSPAHRVRSGPDVSLLAGLQRAALEIIPDVRVIPQTHKMIGAR